MNLKKTNSIELFKNNKTPGTDGLPVELYKVFRNGIKEIFMELLEYSITNNILSQDQ